MKENKKRYSHPLPRTRDHQAPHRHLTHMSLFCPLLLLLCSSLKKRSPKHCLWRCSPPAAAGAVVLPGSPLPLHWNRHRRRLTEETELWGAAGGRTKPVRPSTLQLQSHLTPSPRLHELLGGMRKSKILVVHNL